ncbi:MULTISPECIES: hypothetical protein [Maricaulis]|jgi:hypothetical protein|uniref:hypothetical protein n=1 Tax=Maricaulis TaxID=74317 RepID=UPI0025B807BC|nr:MULTISPECIES: hypothetical protein [Maricaulis]
MDDGSLRAEFPKSLIIGRSLRAITGGYLTLEAAQLMATGSPQTNIDIAITVIALIGVYSLIHLAVSGVGRRLNPWFGALLAVGPGIAVYVGYGLTGMVAVYLFIGLSLILDAIRADPGCEVMAFPGLIFRRRTHLACLVFTPIDRLERRIFKHSTG